MKNAILSLAVLFILASCDSQNNNANCYGMLVDSMTKLVKVQERLNALERGTVAITRDYQQKIQGLQSSLDSMKMKRIRKHHKRLKTCCITPSVATTSLDKSKAPFYYNESSQKYMFYDYNRNAYYALDPVTGKKRY